MFEETMLTASVDGLLWLCAYGLRRRYALTARTLRYMQILHLDD
jgi:hypothetical protein